LPGSGGDAGGNWQNVAMIHVVLVHPEIPPNTGNAIRLCANTGAQLHLVRPLGFELDDARLRRAGLDYHEWQPVKVHDSLDEALAACQAQPPRIYAMTTRAGRRIDQAVFRAGDVFVFGRESAGLDPAHLDRFPESQRLRLPMRPGQRSLNLSNAVAVTVFEAWRQLGYAGAVP
jgi:Predicted rRNA methylase (SpoU class)